MKNLAVGLLGAAALAATILLVRQQDGAIAVERLTRLLPAGEAKAAASLERMRELGL